MSCQSKGRYMHLNLCDQKFYTITARDKLPVSLSTFKRHHRLSYLIPGMANGSLKTLGLTKFSPNFTGFVEIA